eukprot:scaffold757_cov246-Pinguiococcus_pyrenoidosus.AAC.20
MLKKTLGARLTDQDAQGQTSHEEVAPFENGGLQALTQWLGALLAVAVVIRGRFFAICGLFGLPLPHGHRDPTGADARESRSSRDAQPKPRHLFRADV